MQSKHAALISRAECQHLIMCIYTAEGFRPLNTLKQLPKLQMGAYQVLEAKTDASAEYILSEGQRNY